MPCVKPVLARSLRSTPLLHLDIAHRGRVRCPGLKPQEHCPTGPEITEQAGPELGAVYMPVSTGGTLAGISAHLRRNRPDATAVAVDVRGSPAAPDARCYRASEPAGRRPPSSWNNCAAKASPSTESTRSTDNGHEYHP
ncbi:pyridoxal-phosphate dependent enzyme [Streptomyces sp. NPDC002785]|uniref:pyridoxal-phosphate dependent enzyme n=1 Tax=Streptomyces sp. NPDC002785 TaxID=3154543 RepID=UPI003328E024